jgi:predicted nucleic acid-binding protein
VDKFLTDTNIIESKAFSQKELPTPLYFSSVVFSELMTACNDTKELKRYQKAWKDALEEKFLIVPTESDWLEASRIQFLLAQERKKDAGGKSPKRTAKIKQELALDCLIAVSACRENITVISNDNDFWAIRALSHKGISLKVKASSNFSGMRAQR